LALIIPVFREESLTDGFLGRLPPAGGVFEEPLFRRVYVPWRRI
jgi:hypothetical protein